MSFILEPDNIQITKKLYLRGLAHNTEVCSVLEQVKVLYDVDQQETEIF